MANTVLEKDRVRIGGGQIASIPKISKKISN